jgi:hypothetical protein
MMMMMMIHDDDKKLDYSAHIHPKNAHEAGGIHPNV